MNRSSLDKLISSAGLIVAVVLLAASGGLFYAHAFIHNQVHDQLAAQRITFPAKESESLNALPAADKDAVSPYAGMQLTNGKQAKVFADNYIAVHLQKIGGGKTYAQLSAASLADPSNTQLAAQVNTVFKGETLRGLLLNAYAFDTMATVAYIAAIGALAASAVLFILVILGFNHARYAKKTSKKRK
ncbi:MAG TPA: hypothetical protein VFI74_05715 [Candidatus Saccharimonadales bacterium]|nr:hypothetical protein [Candidatus Saccharimonadales bacterium]